MERDAALSRRQIPDWTHTAGFRDLVAAVGRLAVSERAGEGGRRDDGESHRNMQCESTDHHVAPPGGRPAGESRAPSDRHYPAIRTLSPCNAANS